MDYIKEAFSKVKQDISNLKYELGDIKEELNEIQISILELIKISNKLRQTNRQTDTSTHNQTHKSLNSTLRHINPTNIDTSTHKYPFQSLKPLNIDSSIGNEGVSTNRQTDKQTNTSTHNQTHISTQNIENINEITQNNDNFALNQAKITQNNSPTPSIVLEQLDSIKKELRFKIKRLTKQEMLVLSSIYQFEEQNQIIDYSLLSQHLKLSESSIRDYVTRIIKKGIPLIKEKLNNKKIILHISQDLRKLASLNTLVSLREL